MSLIYGEGKQKAWDRLQREIQLLHHRELAADVKVPWLVPFERNERFTGREQELARLEGRLFPLHQTSRWAVMRIGGVGKTQLIPRTIVPYTTEA